MLLVEKLEYEPLGVFVLVRAGKALWFVYHERENGLGMGLHPPPLDLDDILVGIHATSQFGLFSIYGDQTLGDPAFSLPARAEACFSQKFLQPEVF